MQNIDLTFLLFNFSCVSIGFLFGTAINRKHFEKYAVLKFPSLNHKLIFVIIHVKFYIRTKKL